MMRKAVMVLAAVVMIALGVTVTMAQETSDQTLFLTFVPNIQFSPFYVAIEKGYFAEAGFNVTIEHGDEPIGVDLIASGSRQFGIISGEQVIAARANGRPVVYVYQWFHQFPVAIVATENSGIESIADLAGRRVGLPGRFGASYSGLIATLSANGMTEGDLSLQEIGFNAPEVICIGGVEAAAVYVNNEPLQIQNRIDAGDCGSVTGIRVFPVSDYAAVVSNGLVTNEQTITENPELVGAMVGAIDQAVRDVLNNPAEAYLMSAAYVEGLPLSDDFRAWLEAESASASERGDASPLESVVYNQALRDALVDVSDRDAALQFEILLNTAALWANDPLGYTDPAAWETTAQTLITMGFLDEAPDLSGAFTNDFLPQIP